jgi:hypothetical protein
MTGQELITELGKKGFTLFLSGGGIGYRYTGEGEPDRERVIPILEELRMKRDEIRGLLGSPAPYASGLEQYPEVFRMALAEVAVRDPQGWAIRQIQHDPQTWAGAQAAEDEVNKLWKQAQGGRMVWEEYQSTVRKWKDKLDQAIEAHKGRSC